MKKIYTFFIACMCVGIMNAQIFETVLTPPAGYAPTDLVMPPSPLTTQMLFIGGVDTVATTATYGNPAGYAPAKEWHDFIGFTADASGESLGWVSVNHERMQKDDRLGDGGGMTAFRIIRNANDEIEVVEQTLADGRQGYFFNVDFANTVGETGMNCGGINAPDGRIWTAEEWYRGCNANCGSSAISYYDNSTGAYIDGLRDTTDFTIADSGIDFANGTTLKKYENFNYMVEIDPVNAMAVRKQYNWGRQPFEGGVVMPNDQTVYFGPDATPAYLTKFEANTPGDFTDGTLYIYKADAADKWIPVDKTMDAMLSVGAAGTASGATMYNRLEWVTYSDQTGKVYFTETGRDNPASSWTDEHTGGAQLADHHNARAVEQGFTNALHPNYWDYYGRILEFDPATEEFSVLLEGGPYRFNDSLSTHEGIYPSVHLSNPDGLSTATILGQDYLIIQEDLNGTSFGRAPFGVGNRMCEVYLLNLAIENPTLDDLIRLMIVPAGAEVTGARFLPDGRTMLINVQHPNGNNPYPYNHSMTIAINGFDEIVDVEDVFDANDDGLQIFPNPTTRFVNFNKTIDAAVYDAQGKRLHVFRNTNSIDVSAYATGVYFIQTEDMEIKKLIIQ